MSCKFYSDESVVLCKKSADEVYPVMTMRTKMVVGKLRFISNNNFFDHQYNRVVKK